MRIKVHHETLFHFETPQRAVLQALRVAAPPPTVAVPTLSVAAALGVREPCALPLRALLAVGPAALPLPAGGLAAEPVKRNEVAEQTRGIAA
jgi:hypothetical protein